MHNSNNVSPVLPSTSLTKKMLKALTFPLCVCLIASMLYYFSDKYFAEYLSNNYSWFYPYSSQFLQGIFLVSIAWLLIRFIDALCNFFLSLRMVEDNKVIVIIVPYLISASKAITILAMFNVVIDFSGLPEQFEFLFDKISSLSIIGCISWILFQLTHMSEQLVLNYYNSQTASNPTARKLYTQMRILKRIVFAVLLVVSLGASLMLFDNVRSLGASVLTTAGIVGIILTLAAQRSLPSLMASIEIALSQPIKIGDAVIVENEFGVIEKINLRYVVVKLWDWRRLVVPSNYFLEKPFQNWSREQSTNLIGTTYLYVDYTMPVEVLRKELHNILETCELWDRKINSIQVSDAKERTMELRILTSARTPANVWDLRCQVREKLINFIVKNYPHCLPHERISQHPHWSYNKNQSDTVLS